MLVEIWSDVVCPWCAVGRARFTAALAAFPHRDDVTVRWRSFELDPDAPHGPEGDLGGHIADKYGITRQDAEEGNRKLTELAAADGLDFHFERAQRGNTFDAHRVLHLAAARGVQDAVKERLFRGYFSEGAHIADHDTLVRLGSEAGLDADEVREVLDRLRYGDDVRADESQAARYGITGVPFFVVDRKYGISGAQSVGMFSAALEQAWREQAPTTAAGGTCGDDSCAL